MMRPIDADAANLEDIVCFYGDECRIEDVKEWLDEQPSIDVVPMDYFERCLQLEVRKRINTEKTNRQILENYVPIVHGKWVNKPYLTVWYGPGEPPEWVCTGCGERALNTYDYCPNCGARMDADTET